MALLRVIDVTYSELVDVEVSTQLIKSREEPSKRFGQQYS